MTDFANSIVFQDRFLDPALSKFKDTMEKAGTYLRELFGSAYIL